MTQLPAYLLVSHGSRDPRPQIEVEGLACLLRERLHHAAALHRSSAVNESNFDSNQPHTDATAALQQRSTPAEPPIGTAVLELAPLPLHQQIRQFANQLTSDTGTSTRYILHILPLFLLPGMHVMDDIPAEVAIAQQTLGDATSIKLHPHLGSYPQLKSLLQQRLEALPFQTGILLAHGSRHPGGNQPTEELAAALELAPAYWSVDPSLETQVARLVDMGWSQIAILPYFLFAGGITDAIAEAVQDLAHQFPSAHLYLADPIGSSTALADLIVDNIY